MVKIAIFKYILQKSKHSTDGFTLPLVLGLGLFMLLTAITMIVRSSDDQISAQLQKQTIENLGIAEAGLNRTLGRLRSGDNSVFLRLTYDPIPPGATRSYFGYLTATDEWSTATLETNMNDGGCGGYPHSISPPTDIFGGMANEGNYRLLAYRYDAATDTGTFLVEGTFQNNDGSDNGVTRLKASVNVNEYRDLMAGSFPGLYMEDVTALGSQDITATAGDPSSIICSECVISDTTNGCSVDGDPLATAIHTDAMSANLGTSLLTNVTPRLGAPALPSVPTPSGNPEEVNISASTTPPNLPRAGDVATTQNVGGNMAYEYVFSSIDMLSDWTIVTDVDNDCVSKTYCNPNGYPVIIYISDDLITNNYVINHIGDFGELAIFGEADSGSVLPSQTINLEGGANADFFVYTPDAEVEIMNNSTVNGVVWTKNWKSSDSNAGTLSIPAGAQETLAATFGSSFDDIGLYTIQFENSGVIQWERQEVD